MVLLSKTILAKIKTKDKVMFCKRIKSLGINQILEILFQLASRHQ
jgi:hypothetical protein